MCFEMSGAGDDLPEEAYTHAYTSEENLCVTKCVDILEMNKNCLESVDDWIRQNNILLECVDNGTFNVDGNIEVDANSFLLAASKENLVDDPLLNMRAIKNKREVKRETVSDCDIVCKVRWDALSDGSKRSDCDNENFTDFSLSDSFVNGDMNSLEPLLHTNVDSLVSYTRDVSEKTEENIPITVTGVAQVKSSDKYILTYDTDSEKIDNNNMNVFEMSKEVIDSEMIMWDLDLDDVLQNDENNVFTTEDLLSKFTTNEKIFKAKVVDVGRLQGSVAIVSNVRNASRPRTKIIIKTREGDERYEGNTSELLQQVSRNRKDRVACIPTAGKHIITSVKTAANINKEVPAVRDAKSATCKDEPYDQFIKEMLSMLGITDDMLYTVLTNLGFRVWVCPLNDCRRIFNRLYTLKIHILSHYGLKPFKVSYHNVFCGII